MIYTRAPENSIDIGGSNFAAGEFRNFLVADGRSVLTPQQELRLTGFSMGRASRDFGEIPGLTINLDHNVIVEIVRSTINESGQTNYGTINRPPDDLVQPIDPAGRTDNRLLVYVNNGSIGSHLHSTSPDPMALWRTAFQIRRGFRKRWNWASAPRIGLDLLSGLREVLILRVAYFREVSLDTRIALHMEFMMSDQG